MEAPMIELLKAIGYPLTSVALLIGLAYLFREFFENLLKSVVDRDLEALKNQNAEALERIRKEHSLVLEDRRAELARETERLKSTLSVEAETYRLVASKRFKVLMELWESSGALLHDTDFSNTVSIKSALSRIDSALSRLGQVSIVVSPELLEQIQAYLTTTATVMTTSEDQLSNPELVKARQKQVISLIGQVSPLLSLVAPGTAGAVVSMAAGLSSMLVPSFSRVLEKGRRRLAEDARSKLEAALRVQFGVALGPATNPGGGSA